MTEVDLGPLYKRAPVPPSRTVRSINDPEVTLQMAQSMRESAEIDVIKWGKEGANLHETSAQCRITHDNNTNFCTCYLFHRLAPAKWALIREETFYL